MHPPTLAVQIVGIEPDRAEKDTPLKQELRREREGAEGAEKARASEAVPLRANRIGQVAIAVGRLRNGAG